MGRTWHSSSADDLSNPSQTRERVKDRKFKPYELYGPEIDLDAVEVRDDEYWTYVGCDREDPCEHCGRLQAHVDAIIIAVDGACRNNGTPRARAAAGVFVGEESEYNVSYQLRAEGPTSQKAELTAGILALQQALVIQRDGVDGGKLSRVIIKADSEYLVKGMTEWVFKWEKNGYINCRGTPVTNTPLFKRLQQLVMKLNRLNVEVLFWHVPRERNQDADMLANMALDRDED